jgi:glutaredoxin
VRIPVALGLTVALCAASALAQPLYRWTDEKGRVHFTDTLPPAGAKAIQKRAGSSGAASQGVNEPYALQLARKNHPVTLYSTPGCQGCAEARRLLNVRGVPFQEVSVTTEQQIEELKKAVGANAVPSLIVGSQVQRGFEEAAYHSALDIAGYPKAGAAPERKQEEPKPK